MRILKFLLFSVVTFGILAVIGFFAGREALLFWGISTVKSSLTEVQSISLNYGQYVQTCRQKGSPPDQIAVTGLQLRFVNDHEYVLELICNSLQFDPIVVEHKSLPVLVKKDPGSGGVIWGNDLSTVSLSVFGRTQSVGVQNKEIVSSFTPLSSGTTPQTTCEGRGYVCCTGDSQFGTGELQSSVNDCPKSCYASCLPRPILLSMTTDPILDKNRTVAIGSNESIQFGYVISYLGKTVPTTTIDFGDGQTKSFTTLNGTAEHTYTCSTGVCNYQVHLTVNTPDQITSVVNDLSQLTVQVSPR